MFYDNNPDDDGTHKTVRKKSELIYYEVASGKIRYQRMSKKRQS